MIGYIFLLIRAIAFESFRLGERDFPKYVTTRRVLTGA